jgi:hypothetical protein
MTGVNIAVKKNLLPSPRIESRISGSSVRNLVTENRERVSLSEMSHACLLKFLRPIIIIIIIIMQPGQRSRYSD